MIGMDSVVVALAIHAASGSSPAAASSFVTPTFLASLPCVGPGGDYNEVYGVRSDGQAAVFVTAYLESRVYKFDLAGNELTHWSSPSAHGVAVAPSGEVFVSSNSGYGLIDVYSSSGMHLRQFGQAGGAFGFLYFPTYLCVTPEGTLLVADSQNQRIVEFEPDGNPIRTWGGPGTGPGQFAGPRGIAMDGAGEILVCDEGNKRVQVFSRTGAFLRQWSVRSSWFESFSPIPRGIAVDEHGLIYVTDRSNSTVRVFQSDGTQIGSWGGNGLGPGQLYGPNAIDLELSNRIYVGEGYCHVQVFSRDGATPVRPLSWGALKAIYR